MKRAIFMLVVLLAGFSASCVRRIEGETPEQFKTRKKAIYSAQVVTSLGGLTDLMEIFVESQVLDRNSGFRLVDLNDQALVTSDTLRERLQTGYDANVIKAVREVLDDIEKARKAGAITFKSSKAAEFYFEAIASIEVTLNLIEAVQAGTREPSIRAAGDRALQRLQAGADEPKWWNRAIVKATEIARILAAQGSMDAATAWADAKARSEALHTKHNALRDAWK